MATLTIEISERAVKTIIDLVEQLGGKVVATDWESKNGKAKLSRKEKEFLKGLDEAVDFVNNHPKGVVKRKTVEELLDELEGLNWEPSEAGTIVFNC